MDDTFERHTTGGVFSADRGRLHERIIAAKLAGAEPQDEPEVVLIVGGPASGKSRITPPLEQREGIVYINVDHVRAELPEWPEFLAEAPEDAAARTHREASLIAKSATLSAMQARLPLIIEGVGSDDAGQFCRRIRAFLAAGYRTTVRYATVPIEVAEERERRRFEQEQRAVAPEVLRSKHAEASRGFPNVLKLDVERVELWDNSGAHPVLIAAGTGGSGSDGLEIHDPGRYDEFLRKGDPDG